MSCQLYKILEDRHSWRGAADCKSVIFDLVGSNLTSSTKYGFKVFMDARMPVTHEEGDRYPLKPPILGSLPQN